MEFDFGNILYIIVTIVAIVAGLTGKKKKPGQKKPGGQNLLENLEKALSGNAFEQPVDDLAGEEVVFEEEDSENQPEVMEESASDGLLEAYEAYLGRQKDEAGTESPDVGAVEVLSTGEIDVLELEESTDFLEMIEDFDAGAAVVYSSIINRIEY